MKTLESKNQKEINDMLSRLNFCHDASMKKICFFKSRDTDEKTGDLIYPFENINDCVKCNIEIELIHNSYTGAKKNQIVLFEFKEATRFSFMQKENFDYSNIYEVKLQETKNGKLEFNFYVTKDKINALSISCDEVIFKES